MRLIVRGEAGEGRRMAAKLLGLLAFSLAAAATALIGDLAPLLPSVQTAEMIGGGDLIAVSLFISAAGFVAAQVFVGWPLDLAGPVRTALTAMLLGGVVGSLLAVLEASWMLVAALALSGAAAGVVFTAGVMYCARAFRPRFLALAIGGFIAAEGLAHRLMQPLASAALDVVGRRGVAAVAVAVLVVAALLMAWAGPSTARASERGPDRARWGAFAASAALLAACAAAGFAVHPSTVMEMFQVAFATQGAGLVAIADIVSVATMAGGALYCVLDWATGVRRMVLIVGTALLTCALAGCAFFAGRSPTLTLWLFASVAFFGALYPVLIAACAETLPRWFLGRGLAVASFLAAAVASALSLHVAAAPLVSAGGVVKALFDRLALGPAPGSPVVAEVFIAPFWVHAPLVALALGLFIVASRGGRSAAPPRGAGPALGGARRAG